MRTSFVLLIADAYLAIGFVANAATPGFRAEQSAREFTQVTKVAEEHAHPEHGPHGGQLIELGKEEFHVEFLHDEKQNVIFFFLLDSAAKKAVAIPAKEVAVNVKEKGRGKQYKVAAMPQKDDPKGTTTCFASKDAALIADLEKHGIEAVLVLDIGNKQYRGKIEHDHDHAHEHAPAKK